MTPTIKKAIGWTAPVVLLLTASVSAETNNNMKTCMFAGEQRTVTADTECPKGLIETLRTLELTREVRAPGGETETITVRFDQFANLLSRSGLEEGMSEGTFTVLAPTNTALRQAISSNQMSAPATTQEGDETDTARRILAKHIWSRIKKRSGCYCVGKIKSLAGDWVEYNWIYSAADYVNGGRPNATAASELQETDIVAANGVIHVIDHPFME